MLNQNLKNVIEVHDELLIKEYNKNDIIFHEGDEPSGIYYILSGKVKIQKNQPVNKKRIVYFAAKGEFLGIHAVINNHSFTNTAIAIDKTKTFYLRAADFRELVESDNAYKLLVMQALCSRIENMEHHINLISEMQCEQKFADTLLMLIRKYGLKKSKILNINITLDDLASYTSTSKSYLKKIVSEIAQKGVINYQNGLFIINNKRHLESIAYNE